jgi:hypothetical protein
MPIIDSCKINDKSDIVRVKLFYRALAPRIKPNQQQKDMDTFQKPYTERILITKNQNQKKTSIDCLPTLTKGFMLKNKE